MSSCRHGNPLTWGSWSSHDLLRFDLTSVCADRVPTAGECAMQRSIMGIGGTGSTAFSSMNFSGVRGMNAVEFDTTPEEKLEVTAAA